MFEDWKDINSCKVRSTKDHRKAQLLTPEGEIKNFLTDKQSTGEYKARMAAKEYRPPQKDHLQGRGLLAASRRTNVHDTLGVTRVSRR
jgi:hypothetical protein